MTTNEVDIKKEIGSRVAIARKAAGLTQEALAEVLDVNLVTVSRLERGNSLPGVVTLLRICEAISLPPSKLFDLPLGKLTRKERLKEIKAKLSSTDDADLYILGDLINRLVPGKGK